MGRLGQWRRVARAHPTGGDTALAALLFVVSLLPVDPPGGPPRDPLSVGAVLIALAGCAALVLRRRYPLPVLAVVTGTAAGSILAEQARGPFVLTVALAAYTVATRTDRRTAVVAGAASALVTGAAAVATLGISWWDPAAVVLVLWFGVAVAAGDAVRSRRAYVAVLEERARRAEQTREQEARRRVAEERLRIARELHDVVAHHIALINVQAGVAGHLLREQPDAAEEALGHVRAASRTVLDELGTVLGVLRRDEETDAPVEPAPSLNRLDALVEGFATGQPVRWTVAGQPRPLPTAVDVAAYRIIQESLTNAHRHARGAAVAVRLRYDAAGITIEVRDDGVGSAPDGPGGTPGAGMGLLGMRERAESAGGTLTAGPHPGGGFLVRAQLPAPEEVLE
ncbi:sensor histidine kinase [Micromonospora endolithica]|uniref:Oxygen sensor histidine kinase NreB n=1 Tax=Micromonospora endolithica TaxID=230091 RepID=A0A3A9ZS84_9ACTN|nr:sensor histidine kinase [Micromonospora endolithica]RKN51079.1 sensor histidine kinase [Micromonospora endolithica]TWJ20113.1 signal transduction histidine kinase [Micromonospora endolithica]